MHVYRLVSSGELRAVDISRKGARKSKTRIRSDDLDAYIDSQDTVRSPYGSWRRCGLTFPGAFPFPLPLEETHVSAFAVRLRAPQTEATA